MAQTDAHDVRSDDVITALIHRIDQRASQALGPDVRIPDDVALGLLRHGAQHALFAVAHTDSPSVLAIAARRCSPGVQQAVAACQQTDDATVAYLWETACDRCSFTMLSSLADRVPIGQLTELWMNRSVLEGRMHAASAVASMLARRPIDELCEAVESVAQRTAPSDGHLDELAHWVTNALNNGHQTDRTLSADLVRLYEAVPADRTQARASILAGVASRGPVDEVTLKLLASPRATDEVKVTGSMDHRRVDDTAIIRLLETAPERLVLFRTYFAKVATPRPAAHMALAEFLLLNAARFPERALSVLAGKLVPAGDLDPALIETSVRAIPEGFLDQASHHGFETDLLLAVTSTPLASDVIVKMLRHQATTWYRATSPMTEWLAGCYRANPPTVGMLVDLIGNPGSAFGHLADSPFRYIVDRLAGADAALEYLGTIPGMLDLILETAGPGWVRMLADDTVAAHVAARLIEQTQLRPDNITQMLFLLERTRVGYSKTMYTLHHMT